MKECSLGTHRKHGVRSTEWIHFQLAFNSNAESPNGGSQLGPPAPECRGFLQVAALTAPWHDDAPKLQLPAGALNKIEQLDNSLHLPCFKHYTSLTSIILAF